MLSRTSFDSYEEGKEYSTWDEKIDWTRSESFTFLSPVSTSSESDVPPPPPTHDSDSSSSTFADQASSSSFENNNSVDGSANSPLDDLALIEVKGHDDYVADSTASTCRYSNDATGEDGFCSRTSDDSRHLDDVEVIDALALLDGYEQDFNDDYEESVEAEISGSNNNLESFIAILGRFALRCSCDHWKCVTKKEKEKHKQVLRQQACLLLLQMSERATARDSFLLFKRIVWQENAIDAMRQRKLSTVFRSWKDVTTASNIRRKVYFLMMIFNRWRVLTEEKVSMRQKKYAALMHWATRLSRKAFSALSLHAASQREERERLRDRYQSATFRSSFRSPEQSLLWRNDSSPDLTNRLSFSKSRNNDQIRRYKCNTFASSRESFAAADRRKTPFDSISISPSARINKNLFQGFGLSQDASRSSYQLQLKGRQSFSSEMNVLHSRRMSLSQPSSSLPMRANKKECTIPFGCEADDIV